MDKLHHSKVDNWLLMAVVSCAMLVLLAATLLTLAGLSLIGLILFFVGAVLPMWVVMATRYHIIEDELRVRAGPFRWRIPLSQISQVTPCHNTALAPAMSRERLQIVYQAVVKKGADKLAEFHLFISPEDRYQFIVDLGVAEPEMADPEVADENKTDENEEDWLQ